MQEVKETHKIVLEIIKANPGITRPKIADLCGKSKNIVQNSVIKLEAQKLVHPERLGANLVGWYAAGQVTIIRRVENAIIEADKAVHYVEIAAMCNLTPDQVSTPIHRLLKTGVIYRGGDVILTNKAVFTYLHPSNNKAPTAIQASANRVGVPLEEYEDLTAKGCSFGDIETFSFLYAGIDELPQFMKGSNAKRLFVGAE